MLLGGRSFGQTGGGAGGATVKTEADTSTKVKAVQRGKWNFMRMPSVMSAQSRNDLDQLPEMRVKARIRFGGRRD